MEPSLRPARRLGLPVRGKTRAWLAFACAFLVVAFVTIFIMGQHYVGAEVPDSLLVSLYPGVWPPFARGVLWLVLGAAAVVFDLLVLDIAETRRGRMGIYAAAAVTGSFFLAFSIASFAGAPWTVVH